MENYEEYLILYADGELDARQTAELMAFINLHPQLEAELRLYEQTKLTPDYNVTYADKAGLLRPEAPKTIALGGRSWAIAASVAALLVCGTAIWQHQQSQPAANAPLTMHQQPKPKQNATSNPQPVAKNNPQSAAQTTNTAAVAHPIRKPAKAQNVVRPELPIREDALALQTLKPRGYQRLEETRSEAPGIAVDVPAVTTEPVADNSWLAQIPVAEMRRGEVSPLGFAISKGIEGLRSLKSNIESRSVMIKVENKKLIVLF